MMLRVLMISVPWIVAVVGTVAGSAPDPRSTEILRYDCRSEFRGRDITLFANGTVRLREGRLREGRWEDPALSLDELPPEAVAENLRVLRSVYGRREVDRIQQPVERSLTGVWVEECEIYLALPEVEKPLRYEFTSYDIPPLQISRIIHIAEELAKYVRPTELGERLPKNYVPQFGDVLRSPQGIRFQVLRLTVDQRGVELQGIEQPLRIYVALEDLEEAFVAVETSNDGAWWWRR